MLDKMDFVRSNLLEIAELRRDGVTWPSIVTRFSLRNSRFQINDVQLRVYYHRCAGGRSEEDILIGQYRSTIDGLMKRASRAEAVLADQMIANNDGTDLQNELAVSVRRLADAEAEAMTLRKELEQVRSDAEIEVAILRVNFDDALAEAAIERDAALERALERANEYAVKMLDQQTEISLLTEEVRQLHRDLDQARSRISDNNEHKNLTETLGNDKKVSFDGVRTGFNPPRPCLSMSELLKD